LKTEKQKRELIPIPIIETGVAEPSFKTKPKRKRIIGSVPLFKMESESETVLSPMHSEYIQNVLRRKVSHDPTFGVYQDDTGDSFKIGRSSVTYKEKYVFVDGRKYKTTQGLWKLLTKSKPDKNVVALQDRKAYNKYSCSLMRIELIIAPQVRSKPTSVLNIRGLLRNSLPTKTKCLGNRYNKNVSG